ncbi:hypothetical protein AMTR_s00159p00060860 [Amborella trichopoda]|uniref:Uncharacterized protein n=1 Tax=Amborella trichopoda TaxID=13333 RepID=W1PW99_AMBTC|nr:hypothetical protein AMTR_s00159p00060860 [Amborella trichopoda]
MDKKEGLGEPIDWKEGYEGRNNKGQRDVPMEHAIVGTALRRINIRNKKWSASYAMGHIGHGIAPRGRLLMLLVEMDDPKVNSEAKPIHGTAQVVDMHLGPWSGKVDMFIVPLNDYLVVQGMDFLSRAKVVPMPFASSVCIMEGPPCKVPVAKGAKTSYKTMSAMQLTKVGELGHEDRTLGKGERKVMVPSQVEHGKAKEGGLAVQLPQRREGEEWSARHGSAKRGTGEVAKVLDRGKQLTARCLAKDQVVGTRLHRSARKKGTMHGRGGYSRTRTRHGRIVTRASHE